MSKQATKRMRRVCREGVAWIVTPDGQGLAASIPARMDADDIEWEDNPVYIRPAALAEWYSEWVANPDAGMDGVEDLWDAVHSTWAEVDY
jgi:hypothetical protein